MIASSLTAIAVPPLLRTMSRMMKSPYALGTRRPAASVCASGHIVERPRRPAAPSESARSLRPARRSSSAACPRRSSPALPSPRRPSTSRSGRRRRPWDRESRRAASSPSARRPRSPWSSCPRCGTALSASTRSNQPSFSLRSATMRPQSLIRPSTSVRCAPAASTSRRFAIGTSFGMKT